MRWFDRLRRRFGAMLRRDELEREMDEEMRFHLEMEAEDLMRTRGLSSEEARRQAGITFGGVERFKEEGRDVRRPRLLEDLAADVRYALRTLGRAPGFAAAAVLSLALGIGANTAIFGVVDALFLRHPAGVQEAEQVVRLYIVRDEGMIQTPSGGPGSFVDYRAIRAGVRHFSGVAAFLHGRELDLGRGEAAQRIRGRAVSHTFFPLLGVATAEGRVFAPEEDSIIGASPVAVISHGFWQRHYGGDPTAVGSELLLNGQIVSIIGIAQQHFTGIEPDPVDVWVPLTMAGPLGLIGSGSDDWRESPHMATLHVIGRLAPATIGETPDASIEVALRQAAEAAPGLDPSPEVLVGTLVPAGGPHQSRAMSLALWLLVVTAIVLVIACANVGNLLLSRGTTRRRETAVRLSLGAGRGRIIRQHLTESLVLAGLGGAVGVVLAFWGAGVARQFPLPPAAGQVDARLLLFALGLTVITGVVFGLMPAVQAGRTDPAEGLKESQAGAYIGRGRLRRTLIAVQVALSVVLLVGAGLFVRSLRAVYEVDPGVQVEELLVLSVDLAKAGYGTPEREVFYEDARQRVLGIPGVEAAAMTHFPPFSGASYGMPFSVPGQESLQIESGPYVNWVGPGYFTTVGTTLLRGRGIMERDGVAGAEPVAVVNEALAKAIAPAGDPVGTCMATGSEECTRVIGVAQNQRTSLLDPDVAPVFYLARERQPDALAWGGPYLLIRTRGEADALPDQVRAAVQSLRRDLPYVAVEPLSERIRSEVLPYRLGATLFSLFGILALALAAVGLYGVLGYFVAERRPEIGIRRSLGASEAAVLRLVIWQGMMPVALGLAIGLGAAFVGVRLVEAMLFGVEARDPVIFVASAAFLTAVALLASWGPARRATRVHPMVALRTE